MRYKFLYRQRPFNPCYMKSTLFSENERMKPSKQSPGIAPTLRCEGRYNPRPFEHLYMQVESRQSDIVH